MPDQPEPITQWRFGYYWLRVGDIVRVLPSQPKRHDGFLGRLKAIRMEAGQPVFDIFGGPDGHERYRTLRLERVARVEQTIAGEPRTLSKKEAP